MNKTDFLQNYQDKLRIDEGTDLVKAVVTRDAALGARLSAQVSPCAWLNEGAPFQITITMAGGGNQILQDASLRFADAGVADMRRMLDSVPICKCAQPHCSRPAFGVMPQPSNRRGMCETCFIDELNKLIPLPESKC